MVNQLADRCPNCDLILLSGAIFDASAKSDELGPTDDAAVKIRVIWLRNGSDAHWLR